MSKSTKPAAVPPAFGWYSCAKVAGAVIAGLLPYVLPGNRGGDRAIVKARDIADQLNWSPPIKKPAVEWPPSAAIDWLMLTIDAGDALRLLLATCSLPEDASGQAAVEKARKTFEWLVDQMTSQAPELIAGHEFKIERETLLPDSAWIICAKGSATKLLNARREWARKSPAQFATHFEALAFILKGSTL